MLRDLGYITCSEPFTNLLTQGMVIKDGAKMSKSKGNVVDPNALIERYGADTARLFSLFAAPPEKDLDWSDQGVDGSFRFLNRVWRLVHDRLDLIRNAGPVDVNTLAAEERTLRRAVHKTIRKVTEDIEERFHFNTAIASVMELLNTLQGSELATPQAGSVMKEALDSMVMLLAPLFPTSPKSYGSASAMPRRCLKLPGRSTTVLPLWMKKCWWLSRSTASCVRKSPLPPGPMRKP